MEYSFCQNLQNETMYNKYCVSTCGTNCQIFLSLILLVTMYAYAFLCFKICKINRAFSQENSNYEELIVVGEPVQIHQKQPPKYEDI